MPYFQKAGLSDVFFFSDEEVEAGWADAMVALSEEDATSALTDQSTPTVPAEISDRQFFQQLAVMGLITEDEAIAAVATGTLPPAMVGFIDQLPAEQRFAARMALQGATTFLRSNPLVATFGAMQGMTSDDIDNLWRAAFAL